MKRRESMMGRIVALTLTFAFECLLANAAVQVETVPVGNAGNPGDPRRAVDRTCCYGGVPYNFRIGTYEITNTQYTEFLNAVAATDTHQLYHDRMGVDWRSGIARHGQSGSYTYTLRPNMANKPVNWISFWDAARFANWLHNGQPAGAQDEHSTEEGAYTLGGVTYPKNDTVSRNADARWFLPSENEWHKAAYYDPRTEAQGGPLDDDFYWRYATRSDEEPIRGDASPVGDITNPGPNVANYQLNAVWNGATGNVTTVGGAGPQSASFYGTYDQSGNVWEWNEGIIDKPDYGTFRGNRGGNWDDLLEKLQSEYRSYGGIELCGTKFQCFNPSQGFRVATLFSPIDLTGDAIVDANDIDLLTEMVNSESLNTAYDLNDDGLVDAEDRRVWVEDLVGTYFGDANLDRQFDSSDFVTVLTAGEFEDAITGNSTWVTGDWNGDGEFTTADLVLVFQADNGFEQGPRFAGASVPEPASALSLAIGGALLLGRRLRAQKHARRRSSTCCCR